MPSKLKTRLLKASKKTGFISTEVLNDLLPEDKDATYIDEILDFLDENKIEIAPKKVIAKKYPDKAKSLQDEEQEEQPDNITGKGTVNKDEAQEVEETTTTYLREMGRFDLLTPEEEEKYSKTIREGFDGIIRTIRTDDSGVTEIDLLVERIALWEKGTLLLNPRNNISIIWFAMFKQYVLIMRIFLLCSRVSTV